MPFVPKCDLVLFASMAESASRLRRAAVVLTQFIERSQPRQVRLDWLVFRSGLLLPNESKLGKKKQLLLILAVLAHSSLSASITQRSAKVSFYFFTAL